jgi:predicted small secreted protein
MKPLVLLLSAVIGLAACNTMAGFGKDMEKAGEKIQEKAKK